MAEIRLLHKLGIVSYKRRENYFYRVNLKFLGGKIKNLRFTDLDGKQLEAIKTISVPPHPDEKYMYYVLIPLVYGCEKKMIYIHFES